MHRARAGSQLLSTEKWQRLASWVCNLLMFPGLFVTFQQWAPGNRETSLCSNTTPTSARGCSLSQICSCILPHTTLVGRVADAPATGPDTPAACAAQPRLVPTAAQPSRGAAPAPTAPPPVSRSISRGQHSYQQLCGHPNDGCVDSTMQRAAAAAEPPREPGMGGDGAMAT